MEQQSNVPRLRFAGFVENWEQMRVGDHTYSSAFGPRFSSDLYSNIGNVVTLRTTDMDLDGNIDYEMSPRAEVDLKQLREHLLLEGDLVISRSGTIGITGIFEGYKMPVLPGAFLIRFRLDTNNLHPKFIQYLFNSEKGRRKIESLAAGGVQKNLTGTSILNLAIVAPHIPEQQKIASFLTAVDEKLQALKKKKSLLEQYKKGVMQKIFSQELRFRDDNGEEFPDWEENQLSSICDKISDGYHGTPVYSNEGEFHFINGNNLLNNKIIVNSNTKRVDQEQFEIHRKTLSDSTILLSINGTIGNIAFYNNEKVILGKSVCYINLAEHTNKLFIFYQLGSARVMNYFDSELTGTTIKNLSLATIKNTNIYLPFLPE